MGVALATIPLFLQAIGDARYGVLALTWLLLGYFGVFDLGLGTAASQRMAALERSMPAKRARVFWTALAMNAALGIGGGILLSTATLYAAHHLVSDSALRAELVDAVPWMVTAVPVATLSTVLIGSLQGRSQFLELSIIGVLGSAIAQTLPLLVALAWGPELPKLIGSVVLSRALTILVLFWRCFIHVPASGGVVLSRITAGQLLRFGGWVTLSSIVGPLMVALDRFAIATFLGARAVAQYAVPFQLTERLVVLPAALAAALFPRIASRQTEAAGKLVIDSSKTLICALTPIALAGVLAIKPFIGWWITPEFAAHAGEPAQILIVAFWLNSCAQIPFSQLRAVGRPDLVAKCHLGELLPYLVLLYVGVKYGGLVGAALAFLVRVAADCLLLMRFSGLLNSLGLVVIAHLMLLIVALIFTKLGQFGAPTWWIGMGCLLVSVIALLWRTAPKGVMRDVTEQFRRFA